MSVPGNHPIFPPVSERVGQLHAEMTLTEKLAQLVGYWVDKSEDKVAPLDGEFAAIPSYADATAEGIGHLTRVYGTRPVEPLERARWLWSEQRRLREQTRLGIPALVHEECLTGLAAWKASTFPTPLAWGAAFNPELIGELGAAIGASMRELGIHQGLAPVLDVIRDPRWGRVDECISEDPYVVGTIGTAYVRGLQSAGVHATLKHFVGYSASQAGRNHAPVHLGARELRDVLLPPFEMAVRDGNVRSVMNSYAEIDGVPVAAGPEYLSSILRDEWNFDGTVVSDYFSVAFLQTMHRVAADRGEAAELALQAGIDVELPTGDAFTAPLAERIRAGVTDEALVDRAVLRVLAQKEELGLLDETFDSPPVHVDLDSPRHRELALRLAQESLVLLTNDGTLPLHHQPGRIAVLGPNAGAPEALMGCYSFANHVLAHHPDVPLGFEITSILDAVREEFPGATTTAAQGCDVEGDDRSGIPGAAKIAAAADVAIVVVGDRAGLFGRGTVGEGNDVESLELPGVQRELVEAVVRTGTPTVVVVLSGRPYALGWAVQGPDAPAAVLQAFFPGEEGGPAVAAVLSGQAAPSGHLPVSLPRSAGSQPFSYLHPVLGGPSGVTSADSTPVLPFGHGLTYTTFEHAGLEVADTVSAGEAFSAAVTVRNTGERAGTDLVQLYARDVYASVTRPVAQLLAYARISLEPGESGLVTFDVPTARLAFTGRQGVRIVEPGDIELWVGPSCAHRETTAAFTITGREHAVTADDSRLARHTVEVPAPASVA
ncbi:beta-glucosidase [Arthrobacter liuii]|uniref:Beta-glucosidase n=1 Tax=Arthrobacter liuii TaxID=1476996 RepID=A0ABQ2ALY3_9MICC|nr:glycoside hydrolase family 3 N-terminal domain-containing protein [Arthrobacter liuii]GGH91739.1 beta-glucosidase [Arthrobacter liuii]